MASWVVQIPWMSVRRSRWPLEMLTRTIRHSRNHIGASFQLTQDSPAAEALKRHPYPSHTLDLLVFEERSEEYSAVEENLTILDIPKTPRSSVQTLIHLVEQGDYKSAERVIADLIQLRIEIPLDTRYEKAAIASLELPEGQAREKAFTTWFHLIPIAYNSPPRSFHTISQKLLFSTSQSNLPLVLRFGLICASKGYARKVFRRIIPFVIRFCDPHVSTLWLKEFEKFAVDYMRESRPAKMRKMLKSFRDLAIRSHCLAGRTEEALRMFQATMKDMIPTSRFTAFFLSQHSQKINDATNIRPVTRLRHFPSDKLSKLVTPSEHLRYDAVSLSAPSSLTTLLAAQLRFLKRYIASNSPPTARAVVDFIGSYYSTGRRRALVMLRKKAFQHSPRSTSLWVMAEMIYYLDQKRYNMVLITFSTHFHLFGVPRDQILKQLAYLKTTTKSKKSRMQSRVIPGGYPMTQKLHPSSTHTTLLWKALIHLSKGPKELQSLYQQLLNFAQRSRTGNSSAESSSPSLSAVPPVQVTDDALFNPFVFEFRQRIGPHRAFQVLQDMKQLDIRPNYYQYASLAEGFAHIGDVQTTGTLLEEVERLHRESDVDEPDPYPNIVTMYTNILRSYITTGCMDAAIDVEERLIKNTGYVAGNNAYTDEIRSLLRDSSSISSGA